MKNLINYEVSSFEKKFVYSVVFLLYLTFCLAGSFSKIEYVPIPDFISICGVSIFLISLQTSFLLYNQSKITQDGSDSLLASGYLLISFLVLGRTLFLPGTVLHSEYLNEDSQTSAWLWTIWHLIFPIYIIAYSLVNSKIDLSYKTSRFILYSTIFISIPIVLFFFTYDSDLPKLINGNNYDATTSIDLALFLLCILALLFLIIFKKLQSRQNLWLFLALSVYGLDILYGVAGGSRYTVGWYLAMVNSVVASFVVLGVFIYHLTQIAQNINNERNHFKIVTEYDELTKIFNRRKFNLIFETLWNLSMHQKKPLCLILIDIDDFKIYNDTFGHPKGDECLIRIADILKKIPKRETDLVARIGGEEFAILLYGINEAEGAKFAEKARKMVEAEQISSGHSQRPFVTISVGYGSIIPTSKYNYKNFISQVDEALYRSKANGKNMFSHINNNQDSPKMAIMNL